MARAISQTALLPRGPVALRAVGVLGGADKEPSIEPRRLSALCSKARQGTVAGAHAMTSTSPEGVASPRQGEPRFTISHYEGDPTNGIIAFDNDPELRGCIEIGDERRAEALCRALASHLGCEVGPKGWKGKRYEKPGFAIQSDPSVGGGWWAYYVGEDEETGLPFDTWYSAINEHDGFIGPVEAAATVEALSRDTATEPEP